MNYKIAYLSSKNPNDKRESSGVYYYQSRTLQKNAGEIELIGPVNNIIIDIFTKIFSVFNSLMRKNYAYSHSILISKIYGYIFTRRLKNKYFDFIIADKSSCEIAYLKTNIPIIYSTDGTFSLLHDYYPQFSDLFKISVWEGNRVEKKAIENSSVILCTSQWAARSVINDYGYNPEKVFVLPRGANIDKVPDRSLITRKKKGSTMHLLYMGQEWQRKGYEIAFNTMNYIRKKGIPVKLVVAGFCPPALLTNENVEVINYINKNTEKGMETFQKIMLESDFYILPTRAECLPITFCETGSYGLITITTNTGGVTEVIKDGHNGYALDYNDDHKKYGEKIIEIYNSDDVYYKMVESSRKEFDERLNWDIWGQKIKQILDNYFANKYKIPGSN
jgi:glycosyltransferase involved in cell wall biosynthesis